MLPSFTRVLVEKNSELFNASQKLNASYSMKYNTLQKSLAPVLIKVSFFQQWEQIQTNKKAIKSIKMFFVCKSG